MEDRRGFGVVLQWPVGLLRWLADTYPGPEVVIDILPGRLKGKRKEILTDQMVFIFFIFISSFFRNLSFFLL